VRYKTFPTVVAKLKINLHTAQTGRGLLANICLWTHQEICELWLQRDI